MFTLEEKKEIAKYLINNWNFDENDEDQVFELDSALEKAKEALSNGNYVRWAKTPSVYVDELIENEFC